MTLPGDPGDASVARIPLHARDGSIRAVTTVDAADEEWVNRWRWHLSHGGYITRNEWVGRSRCRTISLHREILGLGDGDGLHCDHIDRDPLNNRRSNLRTVTHAANMHNVPGRGGASRYRGVTWSKLHSRWRVVVGVGLKKHHIGLFKDEEVAGEAARLARRRLMPFSVD